MSRTLDHPIFSSIAWLLVAAMILAAAYLLGAGFGVEAALLLVAAASTGFFIRFRQHLPRIFDLIFALAAVVNAGGYAFGLWQTYRFYDDVVHVYTSFAICAILGFLILGGVIPMGNRSWLQFGAVVVGIGFALGVAWEIAESMVIQLQFLDTVMDLVADTLGAVAAVLFCIYCAPRTLHSEAVVSGR